MPKPKLKTGLWRAALGLIIGLSIALTAAAQPNAVFAEWPNKWVVLNYWATWCPPCREEIPALNRFYRQHSKEVVVIGVSYDPLNPPALEAAIKEMGIQFPVLSSDPGRLLKLPQLSVVPTSFIFDPQGKRVAQLTGPQTAKDLEKIIYGKK